MEIYRDNSFPLRYEENPAESQEPLFLEAPIREINNRIKQKRWAWLFRYEEISKVDKPKLHVELDDALRKDSLEMKTAVETLEERGYQFQIKVGAPVVARKLIVRSEEDIFLSDSVQWTPGSVVPIKYVGFHKIINLKDIMLPQHNEFYRGDQLMIGSPMHGVIPFFNLGVVIDPSNGGDIIAVPVREITDAPHP